MLLEESNKSYSLMIYRDIRVYYRHGLSQDIEYIYYLLSSLSLIVISTVSAIYFYYRLIAEDIKDCSTLKEYSNQESSEALLISSIITGYNYS